MIIPVKKYADHTALSSLKTSYGLFAKVLNKKLSQANQRITAHSPQKAAKPLKKTLSSSSTSATETKHAIKSKHSNKAIPYLRRSDQAAVTRMSARNNSSSIVIVIIVIFVIGCLVFY